MPNKFTDTREDSPTKHVLMILQSRVTYRWSRKQALNQLLSMFNFVGDKRILYKMWADFCDLSEILAMKKHNTVRFIL